MPARASSVDRLIEYTVHHPYLVAVAAIAAVAVLVYELRLRSQNLAGVSPQDLIRLMNQGALVLDIRPQSDYAAGHIGGARQMGAEDLAKAGDSLRKYREKPLLVYCDGGTNGAAAVRQLAALGFKQVGSLKGGLAAWRAENLPLVKG